MVNLTRSLLFTISLIALFLIPGCIKQEETPPEFTPVFPAGTEVMFETIAKSTASSIPGADTAITVSNDKTDPPLTLLQDRDQSLISDVDFSEYFLIAVCTVYGGDSYPDEKFKILKILQDKAIVRIVVRYEVMGPTVVPIMYAPSEVVKIGRDSLTQTGEITFIVLDQWGNERLKTTADISR